MEDALHRLSWDESFFCHLIIYDLFNDPVRTWPIQRVEWYGIGGKPPDVNSRHSPDISIEIIRTWEFLSSMKQSHVFSFD
jgi:hypothetical protein